MAKGLERQFDAHVTADATEQWIRLALRDGTAFDVHAIANRVPDCGYKLRRIEVEADGDIESNGFVFASNGQRFELSKPAHARGNGRLHGRFEMPISTQPRLTVDTFEPIATPSASHRPAGFRVSPRG